MNSAPGKKLAIMSLQLLLILAMPAACFGFQKPEPQEVDGKINWVYDYEQGKLLSKTTNRPMFVVIRCER